MAVRARPYPLSFTDVQALLSGVFPSGLRFFLIMDFEATCDEPRTFDHEVIEFPAVLLDASSLEKVDEFREFVRPTEQPRITAFCTRLTSIRQTDVDGAQPLRAVLKRFSNWLANHGLDAGAVLPVTCGDWDLKSMLPGECARKGLNYPDALRRWCNIKDLFSQARQQKGRGPGMEKMLHLLGLKLVGNHHLGIDDARNIARIFQVLLCRPGQALPADPYGEVCQPIEKESASAGSQRAGFSQTEKDFMKVSKAVRDILNLEMREASGEKVELNQRQKMGKKDALWAQLRQLDQQLLPQSDARAKCKDVLGLLSSEASSAKNKDSADLPSHGSSARGSAELDVPKQAPVVVEPQVAVDDEEIDLRSAIEAQVKHGANSASELRVRPGVTTDILVELDAAEVFGELSGISVANASESVDDEKTLWKPRRKRGGRCHFVRMYEADHPGMVMQSVQRR